MSYLFGDLTTLIPTSSATVFPPTGVGAGEAAVMPLRQGHRLQ